jgi:hypothetical protein
MICIGKKMLWTFAQREIAHKSKLAHTDNRVIEHGLVTIARLLTDH